MSEPLALIEVLLHDAGYRTSRVPGREGVLGESASRVVWGVVFSGVLDLLEGWEAEQGWLLEVARDQLSAEKAWELYLVLGCEPEPDGVERHALEAVRRDPAYARKLVVPSMHELNLGKAKRWLAPLEELKLPVTASPPDALELVEDVARQEHNADVLKVLSAYRANRPLFEEL